MRQTVSTPPRGPLTSSNRTEALSIRVAAEPRLRARRARICSESPAGRATRLLTVTGVFSTALRPIRRFRDLETSPANGVAMMVRGSCRPGGNRQLKSDTQQSCRLPGIEGSRRALQIPRTLMRSARSASADGCIAALGRLPLLGAKLAITRARADRAGRVLSRKNT
jgi:hypothetical protein